MRGAWRAGLWALALWLLAGGAAFGQRLMPRQWAVEAYGGVPLARGQRLLDREQWGAGLEVSRYLWGYGYAFGLAEAEREWYAAGRGGRVASWDWLGGVGYAHALAWDGGRHVLLYAGAGFACGYEALNGGRRSLPGGARLARAEGLVYGPLGRLGLECFVADWLGVTLRVGARYLFGTGANGLRPGVWLGLRWTPGAM